MWLFAQQAPGMDWERVLLGYGPLGVFCGVALYFVVIYGRRMAEGHITLVSTLQDSSVKTSAALETLSNTQANHDEFKRSTSVQFAKLVETQGQIVETQQEMVRAQREIQREVSEQRKLQERFNQRLEQGAVIAIQTDRVEVTDESSIRKSK
jgi:membrane-associated HD superfamily phosphohydrolase